MPKSSKLCVEQEGRIILAISAIKNHEFSSLRKAAEVFNIPESTLRRRLKGTSFRGDIRANSHKLTTSEEESLKQWILSLDKRGVPPRPAHVREMANILLSKRDTTSPPTTIGEKWVYNFTNRTPGLKSCFARRYNYQRAKVEDPKVLGAWFEQVNEAIQKYGIASSDIYNFDETGFAMGLIAAAKVVTRSDVPGKPFLLQPGNREWVTAIECISSNGWALPSCIIFKGKVHMEAWYENDKVPSNWRIEVSPNGWTSNEIGLRWLQNHFIPHTTGRSVGKYRLLVLDGHDSHLTPRFDQICAENDIIPICMPAHASHKLQPLDVAVFSPLKTSYGGLIESKMRCGFNHIDKTEFLEAYSKAHAKTFTSSNIYSAFRATGLVPLSPERVLSQLTVQLKTPTPPGSRPSSRGSSAPKTPHTVKQLKKSESTLKKLLKNRSRSPDSPIKTSLSQLIKGAERAINDVTILKHQLEQYQAAHERQLKRRKRSTKQIVFEEGISVSEARILIERRNQADEAIQADRPLPTESAPRRALPKCSGCGVQGHKITHCPNR